MLFKLIDHLIKNCHRLDKKFLLQLVLRFGVPFNSTHHFGILQIDKDCTRLKQKLTWFNKNHLRGTHACALATLGELSAGLVLLRNFPAQKYRFILKEIHCKYYIQGKTTLHSLAKLSLDQQDELKTQLADNQKSEIKIDTEIRDIHEQVVSMVTSSWQIKSWKNIKSN